MKEDSPLASIYVGMVTTVVETLTDQAHMYLDPDEDNPDMIKAVNMVRSQALLDLVSVANQIRNHDRLDYIVNDMELAKAYFAGSRPLQS